MLLSKTIRPFQELINPLIDGDGSYVFNWRDKSYSADAGGFRPVEVALEVSNQGEVKKLVYITELQFAGMGAHAELIKGTDFDFLAGTMEGEYLFGRIRAGVESEEAKEFLALYLQNFCRYVSSNCLDEFESEFEPA
jgi:hypothetical protein